MYLYAYVLNADTLEIHEHAVEAVYVKGKYSTKQTIPGVYLNVVRKGQLPIVLANVVVLTEQNPSLAKSLIIRRHEELLEQAQAKMRDCEKKLNKIKEANK